MRSVADDLRDNTRDADAALTAEERVDRAFRLGDDDLAAFADAHALAPERARHALTRRRHHGRRFSACIAGLNT
jgi:hypothetical protein